MTSTEFAARYRLLKNVATRGARSFLAQQVALGRMVMVHYLDSETPDQRSTTLARLEALEPPARQKLLEILDVDGSPVAVTLFISSFTDFTTWLDSVSVGVVPVKPTAAAPVAQPPLPAAAPATAPPSPVPAARPAPAPVAPPPPAGEFTRAFRKVGLPAASGMSPAAAKPPKQPAAAPERSAGEFTRIFGKVDEPMPHASSPAAPAPLPSTASDEDDSPTLIMEAIKPPRAAEPAPLPKPVAAPAPSDSGSGFTAIFGKLGETPLQSAAPTGLPSPQLQSSAPTPRVMAPQPPAADFVRPAAPPPPLPSAASSEPGEFTQLFQRMSPGGGSPSLSANPFGGLSTPSPAKPDIPRPIDAMPRADLGALPSPMLPPPAILPPPSLGVSAAPPPLSLSSLGAAPSLAAGTQPSTPRAPDAPSVPNAGQGLGPTPPAMSAPSPLWGASAPQGNLGSSFGGGSQSEFTRVLGRVAMAPPPPISIQPPAPSTTPDTSGQQPSKSVVPLVIALNAVLLLTAAIVAYFVLRK